MNKDIERDKRLITFTLNMRECLCALAFFFSACLVCGNYKLGFAKAYKNECKCPLVFVCVCVHEQRAFETQMIISLAAYVRNGNGKKRNERNLQIMSCVK